MTMNFEGLNKMAPSPEVEEFQESMLDLQKKLDALQEQYDLIKDDAEYEEAAKKLKNDIFNLTERLITTQN